MARKKGGFWRNVLTGLIVLLPAFITFSILQVLFGWLFQPLVRPVAKVVTLLTGWENTGLLVQLFVAAVLVMLLALIGFCTRLLVIKRFFAMGEQLVTRVPMVGRIYSTMREIANTFSGAQRGLFSRVVLLEWPRAGMYSIGFVTREGEGEIQEKTPEHVVNIFIPTTPNPTSGYLVLAPKKSLIPLKMSVAEGMRLVISGGFSGPEVKVPTQET